MGAGGGPGPADGGKHRDAPVLQLSRAHKLEVRLVHLGGEVERVPHLARDLGGGAHHVLDAHEGGGGAVEGGGCHEWRGRVRGRGEADGEHRLQGVAQRGAERCEKGGRGVGGWGESGVRVGCGAI